MVIGPLVLRSRSGIVDIRRVARLICLHILTTAELTRNLTDINAAEARTPEVPSPEKAPRSRSTRCSADAVTRARTGPPHHPGEGGPRRHGRRLQLYFYFVHTYSQTLDRS